MVLVLWVPIENVSFLFLFFKPHSGVQKDTFMMIDSGFRNVQPFIDCFKTQALEIKFVSFGRTRPYNRDKVSFNYLFYLPFLCFFFGFGFFQSAELH